MDLGQSYAGWDEPANADPGSQRFEAPSPPAHALGMQASGEGQADDSLQEGQGLPSREAEVEPLPASPGRVAPTDFGDLLTQGPGTEEAAWCARVHTCTFFAYCHQVIGTVIELPRCMLQAW